MLDKIFETRRWQEALDEATDKGIALKEIKKLCAPEEREKLYMAIKEGEYSIFPPHIARIPKDDGSMREVYVNEPVDRILLSIINNTLCEMFPDMIHKQCMSYQKGTGTQMVVKKISKEISSVKPGKVMGIKADFSKYFDSVRIEIIDDIFDKIEKRLGYDKNTEPVMNLLRRYYHQDIYFDGSEVKEKFQSLKQGCAVASFLANVVMRDLDDFLSEKYKIYYRYSDDLLVIDENATEAVDEIKRIIEKYGVKLNPKKVDFLYPEKWFTFLGFKMKEDKITLSKRRVKKFQKEIEKRTKGKNLTAATRAVNRFLYNGQYNWATSCLPVINVESDIKELSLFVLDSLRASATGKYRIGGLGSADNLPDRTILRGKGKNVTANRNKISHIDNYISIKAMSNNIKMGRCIFEAAARSLSY